MLIRSHHSNHTSAFREIFLQPLAWRAARKLKIASCMLSLVLAVGLLVSCSHAPVNNAKSDSRNEITKTQSTRQANTPRPGDTRIIDGVEYVYGKNVKYMANASEPEYTWVRKDQYFPDAHELSRSRANTQARQKEAAGEPQTRSSEADATGRKWTSFGEDSNHIHYFYEEDTVAYPTQDVVRMQKKREFPSGAAQKDIVTLDEIDCREARYHSIETSVTYPDGTTRTFKNVSPWTRVYEDSPEEYLMARYCK